MVSVLALVRSHAGPFHAASGSSLAAGLGLCVSRSRSRCAQIGPNAALRGLVVAHPVSLCLLARAQRPYVRRLLIRARVVCRVCVGGSAGPHRGRVTRACVGKEGVLEHGQIRSVVVERCARACVPCPAQPVRAPAPRSYRPSRLCSHPPAPPRRWLRRLCRQILCRPQGNGTPTHVAVHSHPSRRTRTSGRAATAA